MIVADGLLLTSCLVASTITHALEQPKPKYLLESIRTLNEYKKKTRK